MVHRSLSALLPLVACLIGSAALAQEGGLTLPVGSGDAVEWTAPDQGSIDDLRVFVGPPEACCDGKTPIAGTYSNEGRVITFDPAFEFIAGQDYTVQAAGDLTRFAIPLEGDTPAPAVVAIYPSGPEIPENTLRFYIQFSTPMMPHRAGEYITLVDANGTADTQAFMSFTQELWNEDRTRLTLLMDPGRIKRGVAQNLELGPALLEGNRYSIVVADGWPSARGNPDLARFEKPFTVSPALRSLPDTDLWDIRPPRLGTDDVLTIAFDRPFDRHLTQTTIAIHDAQGQRIQGSAMVGQNEKSWQFRPDAPWATPTIRITVQSHLEDVAGNNFQDLLDHSVGTQTQSDDLHLIVLDLAPRP